jgi:hypothetical protein
MWVDTLLLVGKLGLAAGPLSIVAYECRPGVPARGDALSKDLPKCYDQVKNSTLCRSGCKLSIFPVFPTTPQGYDPLLR